MYSILKLLLISIFVAFAGVSHADMQRGIRNYQAIMAGQKKLNNLVPKRFKRSLPYTMLIGTRRAVANV